MIFSRKHPVYRSRKLGMALSGGAALGLAHVGVLKAFEEYNIRPAVISGTSAGALIGALYAMGKSIKEIEDIVLSVDTLKTINILSPGLQTGSIVDDKNLMKFFNDLYGDTRIESMKIPFIATAVDLISGDVIYFNKGSLIQAVRASISLPSIFKPVEYKDMLLVDGGVRDNLPLRILKNYDVDFSIGVNVLKAKLNDYENRLMEIEKTEQPSNNIPIVSKLAEWVNLTKTGENLIKPRFTKTGYLSMKILMSEQSQKEIKLMKPDWVIETDVSYMRLWQFWRGEEAIASGYNDTKEQIEKYLNSRK